MAAIEGAVTAGLAERKARIAGALELVADGIPIGDACLLTRAKVRSVTHAATVADLRQPEDRSKESKGSQAARWAADNGGKLSEAAKRFGVSGEAVRQWWRILFEERLTPWRAASIGSAKRKAGTR